MLAHWCWRWKAGVTEEQPEELLLRSQARIASQRRWVAQHQGRRCYVRHWSGSQQMSLESVSCECKVGRPMTTHRRCRWLTPTVSLRYCGLVVLRPKLASRIIESWSLREGKKEGVLL